MKYEFGRLYTCGGSFLSGIVSANRPGTIQVFDGNEWNICQDHLDTITGYSYIDINCVAADPADPNHIFAGGRPGMYEFKDWQLVKYFNKDNSPLQGAIDNNIELDNSYVLVHSMMFDSQTGNLWLLNSQARSNSIFEYTPEGEFISHHNEALITGNNSMPGMIGLLKDKRELMWFVNNSTGNNSIVCYQPETEGIRVYNGSFQNQNGTRLNIINIRCIAEDNDGNIWIGTNVGPLYLPENYMEQTNPCVFMQVIVPRNDGTDYGDYLLSGIDITAISIDGAGRKWFGTNGNGVYLISEDNMEQIQHFTSENSPLLSDNIESIAVNGSTGEVFFGTDRVYAHT